MRTEPAKPIMTGDEAMQLLNLWLLYAQTNRGKREDDIIRAPQYDGPPIKEDSTYKPRRDFCLADDSGYDLTDPKHPTYHERMCDLADSR